MRSCLVALFLLAGIAPALAPTLADAWIFGGGGARLEGASDHTLRPWPIDVGAPQVRYLDRFTTGESGVEFSPSFRVISRRKGDPPARVTAPKVRPAPAATGIVTYRYDAKRRKFTIQRGLGGREG
jgi:hypothetical protein